MESYGSLMKRAEETYRRSFDGSAWFERAIFISWFCAKPTCKFCFMYTIKDQIKAPAKARRRLESILAEALIARMCDWEIGFVSAGIASFSTSDLKEVLEGICKITGKKQWLNLGVLKESQIEALLPYVEGITGTVECVNENLRNDIVPDKPLDKIEEMFHIADRHGLKKSITIIIGLGETIDDYPRLAELIRKYGIDRINFYRLVPHESTVYTEGPSTEYYSTWIARTRIDFPNLTIIAGSWPDKTIEIPILLRAGANAVTKLPAIKLFGSKPAHEIEDGAREAGRRFLSNLTRYPSLEAEEILDGIDFPDDLKARILEKYSKYHKRLERAKEATRKV